MNGTLAVLNVGAGDLRVEFTEDAAANEKLYDMISDMMKHGYALLVEIDGEWHRVTRVDRKTHEYVLRAGKRAPSTAHAKIERAPEKAKPPRRAPVRHARAVGVARSAGGCAPRSREHMLQLAREALRS